VGIIKSAPYEIERRIDKTGKNIALLKMKKKIRVHV